MGWDLDSQPKFVVLMLIHQQRETQQSYSATTNPYITNLSPYSPTLLPFVHYSWFLCVLFFNFLIIFFGIFLPGSSMNGILE